MHELSLCQALIGQVTAIAAEQGAVSVSRIVLQIGPLSGVDADLLRHAYPFASEGTIAEHASLDIEALPVRVRCLACGTESAAEANNLLCGKCGDSQTQLLSGSEMLLSRVELMTPDKEQSHV